MDRLTRKELKTDKFALEVGHGVEYVTQHKQQVIRWGSIAAAIAVVALAIYGFISYRANAREEALTKALQIQEATVPPAQPVEGTPTFPTEDAKQQAFQKALNEVATKYSGSNQAAIAHYYLGTMAAGKGDLATADKELRTAVDQGDKPYASLAKVALAQVLNAKGKAAEGEKLLRSLVSDPTVFVSQDEAKIILARYIAPTNPQEARKILEPLRTERSAISRAALAELSNLPQK